MRRLLITSFTLSLEFRGKPNCANLELNPSEEKYWFCFEKEIEIMFDVYMHAENRQPKMQIHQRLVLLRKPEWVHKDRNQLTRLCGWSILAQRMDRTS